MSFTIDYYKGYQIFDSAFYVLSFQTPSAFLKPIRTSLQQAPEGL